MASQEEDNKLECISNVNKDQERYFLNVYKKHEYILNNKNETFKNKIESLIEVWKSVGELNLSQFDIRHVIQIMDWAKLHALNIVLTAEWNKFKASYQSTLLQEIEKAQNELLKLNSAFATRCKKLSDVVRNPWEDPVLMTLMKTKDSEIGPEEIEFFCVETAYIVSVRLKKLCESHCEDLALNLVTAFMNCNKLSKSQNFSLNATETQMWFIFDIYIALLYKFQEKQKIVVLLKELTFEEGLQLVKRFAKKRVKISKIWKNCQRVAILATQMYISQAVVKYTEELKEFLESYLEIYISLCSTESLMQEFPTCIRRISNLADAAGLYVFCDVIRKKAGTEMKPLVVEMYIRALTTDMNELERQKDGNETEKATATTSRLAEAFCNLANFLDEHVKVARECVLTAFSLEPTKERLENIITLARRSGFQVLDTGQEWKCKLHPPALPTDDVTWICPECGEWMCKPDFTAPIKINMALNEALQNSVLGISEALCDDLVVCLSNPRYQILSWFLPWADLHRLCIMYLQDSQTTKNFVTELKFVDIDYSIFKGIKREPMDEMAGIERGYEQYLDHDFVSDNDSSSNSEDSMSQDSRPYSLGSDGAGEGPYLPMLPPQTKSDPKTLKSLRMFRPSLKRTRDKGPEEGTPEKLYKTDSNNASDSCTIISNAENKSKTENNNSLNKYLTSVTPKDLSAIQYPQLSAVQYPLSSISLTDKSSNKEVSHSKNVKTATLPLLGGQVAKKEFTTIQVNKQLNPSLPKKGRPSLLINLVQTVIPQNLLKNKMETQESPPNRKSLSKLLLNGLSESNSRKTSDSKSQDYCLHSQESPTRIEHPLKIQKVPQLKRISFSQKSCPKILTVCLENLPVDRGQNMMEYKLNQKKSTPTQQADIIQSLQNISQTTQSVGQNLPHKLALLEKQLSNQTPLSSLLNLDQSLIPLTRQEKVPTSSSVLKQLLNKPFQNPGLDQSTIQTTLPSTINHLPKNIQCVSLEQVQKEPVSQINPQTNHIPDMKPPKANQVSTANQLRIHLVNIETLKSRHPSSLGKVQNNSVHATTNQNQSRKNSIKQEQKQTSQLLNLQTPKSRYLLNQDQVTGNLDHQPSLDQTQNSQVKQEQLQTTQLLPLQALKSKFHHQPQVQGNSLHQTHLDNSVKEEHLQATLLPLLQTPRSRSSHQEQIQTNLLHPPNLDQKQNHSIKHEQTSQLPSLQKLIGNSPSNQDQVPNTLIHNPYQEQEQNHTIKKNQSQIIQSPSLHLSQPPTCPENSPITMQTSNSDLSQKNCTQPVDSNLPQKQSNSQEAVEYNQKPSESCFKQPQKQPIKENVTVNQSHQLQKSHCNSFHVPNQEKQLARQEILQTSCSLKPLQSESNYTRSLNLGQTKNHQTNQENLLENQMEQEDNSKCSIQDPTQNQSANREKLQISLPLSLPPGQSILKHSGHIHSQLNTIVREKHRKTENYQLNDPCQENNHLQHISPEQELIHVIPEKLQPHSIPCQQQFPSHIQSPPLEQPQIPVSQHQSQDSLKVLHTIHSSNSDQSCKVMTNQGRQICHSPNPNRSQNSSCSLPKAPSLSPSLDKLQISRSIRNNLKTSSTHNSEKPSHQTCHSQNNVPLVSPKVGKVPCTLKKLPNLTISMEAEILPNLDKFQSSCTPSLSMETEPPSLEKLQARLWPGLEQADTVMDCNNQQLRKQKVVVDKTCQTVNSKDSLKSCLEKKSCCTTLEVMEQNENLVECDRIVAELEEVLQCNSDSKNEDVVVYRSGSCDSSCYENWKNVETASKNDDVEVLRNGISNMVTDENWKNLETAVENNEGDVLRNGMSNMATEENWKNVETEGENNEEVLRNGISDMVTDENWKNVETACKNDDGEVLKNDISNMVTDENWKNGETACKNDDGKALKNAISNMVTDENWKNVETACKNDDGEVLKNGISNMVTDENWKNVETACRNDDGEALKNAISNMVSDENWKNLETACKNDDGKNDDGEALKNAISNMVTDENWKNVETACKNDDGEVSKNGISNMVTDENWKNVETACENDDGEALKNAISNMVTDENWKNVEIACKNDDGEVSKNGISNMVIDENWKNVKTACKNDEEVLKNTISNMVTDENWKNVETACKNDDGKVLTNGISNMVTDENWKNVETACKNDEEVLKNAISNMVTDENWKNVETACKNDDGKVLTNGISNMVTDENWKNVETACENDDGKVLTNGISNMATDENWKNVETACKNDDGKVLKNAISVMVTDENWKNVETACENDDGKVLKNGISNVVTDENWKNVETACENDDGKVLKNGISNVVTDENWKNVETTCKNDDGEILRDGISNMFTNENWENTKTVSNTSEEIAQSETKSYDWLDIDSGIFSDLSENKPEELFFQSSMDCATSTGSVDMIENHLLEELPKNFNLTENIRTYTKKSRKALSVVNKDCIEALTGDDILNVCKNVNSVDSSSVDSSKLHSSVQHFLTKSKELKVVLRRLSSNEKMTGRSTPNMEEYCSIKNKCDRGKTPPKNSRRRRSTDKSENKVDGKAPNLVQNHGLSPLQDINLRPNPRVYSRAACCDLSVLNRAEDLKTQRVLTEQNPANRKSYAKSVLANIPGLNDFQMIKPLNVNHIVNVVQLSGGRPAQNVPLQSQTSTQVTPHIQRIGQPRISDQKPEHSNSVTSTIHTTTTTTTARTTTTQPSTLINILSQQIIRPVVTQANTVRRQTPLINILSQQIIRPSSTAKTANNSTVPVAETNQVKPVVTTEQTVINQVNNVVKNTTTTVKNTNPVTGGQGGTILQFICKSSLPKFQQAFGKTVYQNSTESSESVTATVETTGNSTIDPKKNVTKAVPVNVQPIQGSVIYSRQVPVGQTISLIPPGGTTRQVFRIATSNPEQISLVKDSVIHSKMSALLAAALQGRPKNADGDIQVNCDDGKGTITRPTLVQGARIVKPVQLQLQSNTARATPQPNLSSTTLEQLREFDMVYKQVKERSSTTTNETGGVAGENQEVTQQRISVTYVNQLQKYTQLSPVVVVTSYSSLQPAASPALSVTSQGSSSPCVTPASTPTLPKISSKTSKGKTLKTAVPNNTTPKSSPIPKPQQKPQEDEHTTQRIFDILAEYAEQLRNSPDLNNKPAPRRRSNPPTNPSQNSKRKKSSSGVKKSGHTSNSLEIDADDITVGSEDSSGGGMVQLSVTDDEQSQAATINTTESSDNSSPPSSRPLILTEGAAQSRNLIIADSSVGEALKMPNTAVIVPGSYIMPVSMVKGGQQIAVVSGGSKILATVPARSGQNMLVFQSFTNQHRKGAISAVKYSTIQPISGISSQSLAGVSAQPPVILPSNSVATAVALGQPLTLKKIGDDRDSNEQQLLLTISPSKEESKDSNDVPQPDSSTSVSSDSVDITIESDIKNETDNSRERIYQSYQKSVITNSAGTSVIATTSAAAAAVCNKEEDNTSQSIITSIPADNIKAEPKSGERIHSVLVTACSSNGPMLSHITPRYRKPSDTGRTNNNDLPNKEEFLHNGDKTSTDQKNFRTSATYYVNKMKKVNVDSQKLESEMQKQAAIERELRLQKSLSEECEDLGVDEPSTSDLFPEADLLFDSNHSPSFDQTSQDIMKRAPQSSDIKEEVKETMNLFSDDENSSSLRTDLFEYVEYQTVETALARQMMNGNNSAESGSSGCEDNTLLAKCATMSEVTLNSPISPEVYQESSLHKYKFKYSNRKKGERIKQSDFGEVVSSSEDTFGNAELTRINCEEDNFKVVHVAITKTDIVKEGETCQLHCDEDLDSPSGRGARRSVRKLCSCCNGSKDGNLAKKRPQTSRPHTPAVPHKKAFLNKKR